MAPASHAPGTGRPAPAPAPRPAPAPAGAPNGFDSARWMNEQLDKQIEYRPFLSEEPIKLSARLVLRFLCTPTKSGKVCTEEQAIRFMMLCKARALNPWEGDAYVVGYDSQDGPTFSLITSHQAFLKRAEAHQAYDGMESGVIVVRTVRNARGEEEEEEIELEGDYHRPEDVLVGGWARVHRKDRQFPVYRRLRLAVFSSGRSRWAKDPAGMICKCAEADAVRSAFPNNVAGMLYEGEAAGFTAAAADLDTGAPLPAARPAPARMTPAERVATIKAGPRPDPAPAPEAAAPAGDTGDPEADPFAPAPAGALFNEQQEREREALDATK